MYSKRKTLKNFCLVILLLLSFKVTANVVKEAQDFLIEISNGEGFWFYNSSAPQTQQQKEALLKECHEASEDLSIKVEDKKVLFENLNQQIKFRETHVLLLFTELEGQTHKHAIHEFAEQYQLPLMVVSKKQEEFPISVDGGDKIVLLENVFTRLNANFQDVFLLDPKKRQISLLSLDQDSCLLEQALFFELYKNLKGHEDVQ